MFDAPTACAILAFACTWAVLVACALLRARSNALDRKERYLQTELSRINNCAQSYYIRNLEEENTHLHAKYRAQTRIIVQGRNTHLHAKCRAQTRLIVQGISDKQVLTEKLSALQLVHNELKESQDKTPDDLNRLIDVYTKMSDRLQNSFDNSEKTRNELVYELVDKDAKLVERELRVTERERLVTTRENRIDPERQEQIVNLALACRDITLMRRMPPVRPSAPASDAHTLLRTALQAIRFRDTGPEPVEYEANEHGLCDSTHIFRGLKYYPAITQ